MKVEFECSECHGDMDMEFDDVPPQQIECPFCNRTVDLKVISEDGRK